VRPSALNATDVTEAWYPPKGVPSRTTRSKSRTSHNWTVRSSEAVANTVLSGLNATDSTPSV
jgi:hypothetical protein